MIHTYDTLREYYLRDLSTPCIVENVEHKKTKHLQYWRNIPAFGVSEILKTDASSVYVWSDTHFGHHNIIKYTNRPFEDVSTMNNVLMQNYINAISVADTVIFVGDIGFGSVSQTNRILDALPGYKINIIGNHDIHKGGKVYDLHMDEQHMCMALELEGCNKQLLFTHYPLTQVPHGCINVHGHIHQRAAPSSQHINVGVELVNYTPANLLSLLSTHEHI